MRKRLSKVALGMVLGLGALLGVATPASAADYVGNCAGVPSSVSGIVFITDTTCSLPHSFTATGWVYISATSISGGHNITAGGGSLQLYTTSGMTVGNLSATSWVDVRDTGGSITAGSVSSGAELNLIGQGGVTASGAISADTYAYIRSDSGDISTQGVTTSSGDLTMIAQQDLTAADTLSAGALAYIRSEQGDVSTKDIEVGDVNLQMLAIDGKITVDGDVTGTNTNLVFWANEEIGLQNVNNTDGYDVRIFAQNGGGATAFTVGTGSSNGVESITNTGGSGSGERFIYIANGNGGGEIQYSGSNVLQVQNASGKGGSVVLDGKDTSDVSLSGTLNVHGSSGSGVIDVFAKEVKATGATLSINASGQTLGFINIVSNKVTVNSGGLTFNLNGNGTLPTELDLSLFPTGSYSLDVPTDPAEAITPNGYTTSSQSLLVTGSGAITINANGNTNGVQIVGNSLTVNNTGGITITQQGSGNLSWIGAATTATLNAPITVHANTTSSGHSANQISVMGSNIPSLSGNVLLDAAGQSGGRGSNITVAAGSGTVDVGGSGSRFTMNAEGSSSGGNGGQITVTATTVNFATSGGVKASAKGGNASGGTVDVTASGTITAASGQSIQLESKGFGTGQGGTIELNGNTISMNDGNIDVSGGADGDGGTISLTSAGTLGLSDSALKANGLGGDGGTISLQYVSGSALNVKGVSATGTTTGGSILIANNGSMTVNISGDLDTSIDDGATLSGSTTFAVADDESHSITVNVTTDGTFNSIMNASGTSITFDAEGVAQLGLDAVTATSGDVNITADVDSGMGFAPSLIPTTSVIGFFGQTTAPNGDVTLTGLDVYAIDQASDTSIILPGSGGVVQLNVRALKFGTNTYIEGVQGTVRVIGPYDEGLAVIVPAGSKAGFKSTKELEIGSSLSAAGTAAVVLTKSGVGGTPTLVAEVSGSPGRFTISANGDLGVGVKIGDLDGGVVDAAVSPDYLELTAGGQVTFIDVTVGTGSAHSNKDTTITASQDVALSTMRAGSTSVPGGLTVNGADVHLNNSIITRGPVSVTATGSLTTNNISLQALDNGGVTVPSVTFTSTSAMTLDHPTVTAYGPVTLTAGGLLDLKEGTSLTATATSGSASNMVLKGGTGLSVEGASTLDAKGHMHLSIGRTAVASNADPTARPSAVSAGQIHITSPGVLYWGDTSSGALTITGSTHDFTANGKDLVFDANGTLLSVGDQVTFSAHN